MNTSNSFSNAEYKGISLIKWNFGTALTFFIMALSIFIAWDTPAICYQLTAIFGLLFLINGLLGMTKLGNSIFWKFTSYLFGSLMILFAFPSLYRQISLGQRGLLGGSTYYSICVAMLIIGIIGLAFLYINRKSFKS